jgi:hypothetical protein
MLEDCAAEDEPGAYEGMLNDWKPELQMPLSWNCIDEPVHPLYAPPPLPRMPVVPDDPQIETELTPGVSHISETPEVHIVDQELSAP